MISPNRPTRLLVAGKGYAECMCVTAGHGHPVGGCVQPAIEKEGKLHLCFVCLPEKEGRCQHPPLEVEAMQVPGKMRVECGSCKKTMLWTRGQYEAWSERFNVRRTK